jgi:hypothetical protein
MSVYSVLEERVCTELPYRLQILFFSCISLFRVNIRLSRKRKKIIYKYRDFLITESRFLYMHSYSGFLRNTGSPICGVIKAAPVNILFWALRYFITFHYRGGLQIINFSRLLSSMELILESTCHSRIKSFRKGSEKSPVRGTIPNNQSLDI